MRQIGDGWFLVDVGDIDEHFFDIKQTAVRNVDAKYVRCCIFVVQCN